jgi:hypothetical protein
MLLPFFELIKITHREAFVLSGALRAREGGRRKSILCKALADVDAKADELCSLSIDPV